jgi:hypothetical protein
MSKLPHFLVPAGFNKKDHRFKLTLINPVSGNVISGESTNSQAGRGDRTTMMLFDEAALIADLTNKWMNVADSTDHRFAVSSENIDEGYDFYNLVRGIDMEYSPRPFTIDWYQHPRHDDEWFARERKRIPNEEAFRREVLRDPLTNSYFVYPTAREKACNPAVEYVKGSPVYVSIDPGFNDPCAITWWQYNLALNEYQVINGYTNDHLEAAFYGCILKGEATDVKGLPVEGDWWFSPEDEEVMAWVKSLGIDPTKDIKYFGDMYGDTQNGATADTVYSVLRQRFNIRVLADRTPSGKCPAHKMRARTHKGRRESTRKILPRIAFGDTIGCRQALHALQNNRFPKASVSTGKIPEGGMLRDGTTHYTSSIEYFAVNIELLADIKAFTEGRREREMERRKVERSRGRSYYAPMGERL